MTSSPTPKKIILKGDPLYKELNLQALDVYGAGAITPGMLVERTSANEVKAHATSGGNASPIFATEAPWRLGAGIETQYDQDGERVQIAFCRPGDEVYAFLVNTGNVAIGDLLQSDGAGALMAYSASSPPPLRPVARAIEALHNTTGSIAHIKVEVV